MGTEHGLYLRIDAEELAKWLCLNSDLYWTVDGDPVLSGMLSLPCPGDELAGALRKIGTSLMVLDRDARLQERAGPIGASDLDGLVETEELDARVLQFRWNDSDVEWLLIEDEETSVSASADATSSSFSSFSTTSENVAGETASDGGVS